MWFEQVRAAAFGPLRDAVLDLAPGMNVLWGPNESGKSSWHAAILLGLCGLPRTRGKPRRDHRELEERRSPRWSDDWSAAVTVRLADGRGLEFSQDLARRTGTVRDADLGRDCTGDYLDANSPDGARLVGLDRDSFRAVACVEQAAILRITADAGALQDQLQRAAATAGTESTAREAIELVDAFLKSHVGPRRQNSTRPLQTARNRVAATERALAAARRAHDELLERASAVDVAERVAAQAELAARRAEAAYELARARERLERDERVRALAAAHPVPPPTPADDDALARRVQAALERWEHRPSVPDAPERPVEQIEAELAALPEPEPGDREPDPAVESARRELEQAILTLEAHERSQPGVADPPPVSVPADELWELARRLDQPVPAVDPALDDEVRAARAQLASVEAPSGEVGVVLLVVGVVLGVAGLVGAVLASPAVAGLAAVGVVLAVVGAVLRSRAAASTKVRRDAEVALRDAEARLLAARHAVEAVEADRSAARELAVSLGVPADPVELRRLAGQVDAAARAATAHQGWRERRSELADARHRATGRLLECLADRGEDVEDVDPADPSAVLAAHGRYVERCRRRRELDQHAGRREALEQELRAARDRDAARAAALGERRDAEEAVAAVATELDLAPVATQQAVEAFDRWLAERDAHRRELERRWQEWHELQGLLDGATPEQYAQDTAAVVARAEQLAADVAGDLTDVDLGPDPQGTVRRLWERAHDAQVEAATARSALDEFARSVPSVAEAEEAHAAARRELARVEALEETLQHTMRLLEAAEERVHQDLAPVLASKTSERLAAVTGGRYHEVVVDPLTLAVNARLPDGEQVDALHLSHGTAEQIYLLLRVAMTDVLGSDEPCPILLDDPTVHADTERTLALLGALHEVSRSRQVILFTQEDDVHDWARRELRAPRDRLIELEVLPLAGVSVTGPGRGP